MIRAVIVDDETSGIELINQYLEEYEHIHVVGTANNGRDAVSLINKETPDLVFLDIQMPVLNGIEVVKELTCKPKVIFSTAYDKYAINAFELHAIDYLLKPYTKKRFNDALSRIEISPSTQNISKEVDSVFITTTKGIIQLSTNEIKYVTAYGDYVKMITATDTYVCNNGIGYWEEQLPDHIFFRVHRSTIVNINSIDLIYTVNRRNWVSLKSGEKLAVSRAKYQLLKEISL